MHAKRRIPLASIIVAVATLVVISVIAIPAWRSHQTQTHVADALQVTDAAKLVVMEAATVHGGLANVGASALAYTPPMASSPYVASITIADSGNITLVTKDTGETPDPVLVLIPASGTTDAAAVITWTCTLAAGNAKAVPANCRTISPADQPAPPAGAASTGNSAQ